MGHKIVVVGGRTGASQQLVKPTEIFDGTSWHDAAAIPVPGNHLAAASDGTYLYAVGGHKITETSNTAAVQRFDPATGQWTQLPSMPVAASGLGAAVVGGQLITVGGDNAIDRVQHRPGIQPGHQGLVHPAATSPAARTGMGVTAYRNILYALDGAAQPGHIASTNTVQILRFHRSGVSEHSRSTIRHVHAVPSIWLTCTLRTGPVLENSNDCKHDSGEFG